MSSPFLLATVWHWFFGAILLVTSVFLILLVLVQRGRGGGLTGALGGMGGQSAFGTKAGDLFTRVTMGVAAFWIVMCVMSVKVLTSSAQGPFGSAPRGSTTTLDSGKDGAAGKSDGDPDAKSDDAAAGDSKAGGTGDAGAANDGGASAGGDAAGGGDKGSADGASDAKPADAKPSGDPAPAPSTEGGAGSKPAPESKP